MDALIQALAQGKGLIATPRLQVLLPPEPLLNLNLNLNPRPLPVQQRLPSDHLACLYPIPPKPIAPSLRPGSDGPRL